MNIKRLEAINYRNIAHQIIEPCEGVNIIYGENAQGKTNLVEGIWLFTGCRSFRGARDSEIKKFNSAKTILSMDYYGQGRDQNLYLEIGDSRVFTKNGVKMGSSNKIIGAFTAVVFSPVHLSLIKEGPAERRKFTDIAISQQRPGYAANIIQYNKAVSQRNAVLKDAAAHPELCDMLDVWEERAAHFGAQIISQRIEYIKMLEQAAKEIYSGISSGREKLSLEYISNVPPEIKETDEIKEALLTKLSAARKNDIYSGSTSAGPHRDDLSIKIDGLSARTYASQGQQRSCALALKLGEAAVIKMLTGEQPVALLDDVMSELDTSRQDYILNHIKDWQVFITCCDPESVKNLKYGKAFEVKKGEIK